MMTHPLRSALLGSVLALLVAGCDKQETPAPDTPTAPVAKGAKDKPGGYDLKVTNWEGPTGEEGYVIVTIEAKDGHKINEKYPQKVVLDEPPEGLKLPLRTMKLADAEIDGDKRLTFSIPAVPSKAGEYKLAGQVKLSVCNDETCRIAKEDLNARVVAQ